MRRRAGHIAYGLVCLAGLLVLAVGPPVALVRFVGWPLPTSVPSLDGIDQSVRSGIPDVVIVNVLACVLWLAWAQIALSLLLDVVATVRGGVTPRAPVLPGVQVATGRLVAGVTMLIATMAPGPRVAAAPMAPRPPAIATAHLIAPIPPPSNAPISVLVEPDPAFDQRPTWAVERHQSYWSIAESALGDGLRWREIRDLNAGHLMPDGAVVPANSDTIRPGWILTLPADADISGASSQRPAPEIPNEGSRAVPSVAAAPGDNLWDIAEQRMEADLQRSPSTSETATYWSRVVAANQPMRDPDLIHVGQVIELPATHYAPPAEPPVPPPGPTTPPNTEASPSLPEQSDPLLPAMPEGDVDQGDKSEPASPTPLDQTPALPGDRSTPPTLGSSGDAQKSGQDGEAPLVVGLLGIAGAGIAAGAAAAVRRRRHTRHRRPDRPATAPTEKVHAAHEAVLVESDEHPVAQLRAELDALAVAVATTGQTCRPRIVQFGASHIDVLLDRTTVPAPPGWRAEASGSAWLKDDVTATPELGPECNSTPLLVSLGASDVDGQIYLDLEAEGLVSLTGDDEAIEGVLRSWITELATTTMAADLTIRLLGSEIFDGLDRYERVDHVDDWTDSLADLGARSREAQDLLDANKWANTFAARGAGSDHGSLSPLVLFAAPPDDRTMLEELVERGSGVAVVLVGDEQAAGTEIQCSSEKTAIPAVGLECRAQSLSNEASEVLAALVTEDEDLPEVEQLTFAEAPEPDLASAPDRSGRLQSIEPYRDPESEVLVRVLGDIAVVGGNKPLPGKHTAVVAYIALHGRTAPEPIIDAVWNGTYNPNRRKRLANIVSECRSALGAQHLPQAADGVYSVGAEVMTDAELFDRRVAYAKTQDPSGAVATLQGALDLVEGTPFTYRSADQQSYRWVDIDSLQSTWEVKIANVAGALVDLHLGLGRSAEAVEVAKSFLAIFKAHTEMTEQLMRAYHAAGDRLAVERTYQDHLAALEALELDEPDASTEELYDQLVG